ncbi:hypothetical protein SH501x_001616 [Pirellulaceae bacterium SH501]
MDLLEFGLARWLNDGNQPITTNNLRIELAADRRLGRIAWVVHGF